MKNLCTKLPGAPSPSGKKNEEGPALHFVLRLSVEGKDHPEGVTLTARTERKDLQFVREYRRRTLTSDVKVRNLGL
jgi:hypothetical protein